MDNIQIQQVQQTDEDGKLIMEWRNDEHSRNMFFNKEIKEWNEFQNDFYNKYFSNKIPPLFATYNNEKIAFIGLIDDNDKGCHYPSINLSPKFRGKGLGTEILKKSLQYIKENFDHYNTIIAEIKVINIPSKKIFEKCKFTYVKSYLKDNEVILKYKYEFI